LARRDRAGVARVGASVSTTSHERVCASSFQVEIALDVRYPNLLS